MVVEVAAHVVGEEDEVHRGGLGVLRDVDVGPDVVTGHGGPGVAPARHMVAVADGEDA